MEIVRGTAQLITILMTDESDNETGETGITPTPVVQISKNGGPFANAAGAFGEIGFGWYFINLTATETDTAGPLVIRVTGTGSNVYNDNDHQVVEERFTAAELNRIADAVLRRATAAAQVSGTGDPLTLECLMGAIQTALRGSESGGVWTVNNPNATQLGQIAIGTDGSGNWTSKTPV